MPSTTKALIATLADRYRETREEIVVTSKGRADAWKEKLTAKAFGMEDAFGLLFPDLPRLRDLASDPSLLETVH